jgi:hypothetical protein
VALSKTNWRGQPAGIIQGVRINRNGMPRYLATRQANVRTTGNLPNEPPRPFTANRSAVGDHHRDFLKMRASPIMLRGEGALIGTLARLR